MKSDFETFLETFPPDSRDTVREIWEALPRDMQRELEITMGAFSGLIRRNPASIQQLLRLIARTAGPAVAPLHRLSIVGPVNVGKSTLFNALTPGGPNRAEVSSVPGTTVATQETSTQVFSLVDTPGADHARDEENRERDIALKAAQESDFLLVVFDATRSVTKADQALFMELRMLGRPYLLLLNKIDRISANEQVSVTEAAGRSLGVQPERVLPISAELGIGLERVLLEVAALEPRLLGQLGSLLPAYRKSLSWQAVRRSTLYSALIALTPIPFMDLVPLTAVQVFMVSTLAKIYNQPMDLRRGREFLTAIGAGMLGRTAFSGLSKLGGVPGWVLSSSIASATTLAIGILVIRWFETGKAPEKGELNRLARKLGESLTGSLKKLGRSKPSKESLTQALDELLDEQTPELERELQAGGAEGAEDPVPDPANSAEDRERGET